MGDAMTDKALPLTRRAILMASGALGAGLALDNSRAAAAPHPPAPRSGPNPELGAAIDLAVANLAHEGVDDVFARPIEADLLAESEALRRRVAQAVARRLSRPFEANAFTPAEYVVMPNGPTSFRRLAYLEALDVAAYTALAVAAAPAIERHRIPVSAGRVLSYRFAPSGAALFEPGRTYEAFVRKTCEVAAQSEGRMLVAFDLQQFYANVSLAELDAALARCGVETACRQYLGALLRYWAQGRERGLPIGANASRILAEASLIAVDEELAKCGLDFWRYVDDYRLLVDDPQQAHVALMAVADRLAARGFYLNAQKTQITPISPDTVATARVQLAQSSGTHVVDPSNHHTQAIVVGYGPSGGGVGWGGGGAAVPQGPGPCFTPLTPQELSAVDLAKLHADLFNSGNIFFVPPADPNTLRLYVLGALEAATKGDDTYVKTFPLLIARFPYAGDAVMNALVAYSGKLPAPLRESIADAFGQTLLHGGVSDVIKLKIVGLLKSEGYKRPGVIQSFLKPLNSFDEAKYVQQKAFDALNACGASGPHSWLRERYFDGEVPIKRRAALMLRRMQVRPDEALRAQLKLDAAQDPFLAEIATGLV